MALAHQNASVCNGAKTAKHFTVSACHGSKCFVSQLDETQEQQYRTINHTGQSQAACSFPTNNFTPPTWTNSNFLLVGCLSNSYTQLRLCTDTDADRMQIVSMTHEEWIESLLSNPPRRDTQTWPDTDDPRLKILSSHIVSIDRERKHSCTCMIVRMIKCHWWN